MHMSWARRTYAFTGGPARARVSGSASARHRPVRRPTKWTANGPSRRWGTSTRGSWSGTGSATRSASPPGPRPPRPVLRRRPRAGPRSPRQSLCPAPPRRSLCPAPPPRHPPPPSGPTPRNAARGPAARPPPPRRAAPRRRCPGGPRPRAPVPPVPPWVRARRRAVPPRRRAAAVPRAVDRPLRLAATTPPGHCRVRLGRMPQVVRLEARPHVRTRPAPQAGTARPVQSCPMPPQAHSVRHTPQFPAPVQRRKVTAVGPKGRTARARATPDGRREAVQSSTAAATRRAR